MVGPLSEVKMVFEPNFDRQVDQETKTLSSLPLARNKV